MLDKKQLFIFDLDGTLVDAYRAIERSMNFTLKELGYPPVSYQKVKRNVGRGDKLLIRQFVRPEDLEEAVDTYRAHHKRALLRYARWLPQARWGLYRLKRKKKTTAVASNRPRQFTDIIARKLGLKRYVDSIVCADEINSRKPDPKILKLIIEKFELTKEKAVYIGDMDIDLETARRAGVDAVFVRGGSSTLAEVSKYKNKKVVSSLRELFV